MSNENCVVILSSCRTPIGSMCGLLSTIPAHELGSIVIKDALKRANVSPDDISEVILGQTLTAGQGQNPARLASLKAGLPTSVPAFGVNMLCGSGLKAVYLAYQSIKSNESSIVVAGGQENMSRANHSILLRSGIKLGDAVLRDTLLVDGLTDSTATNMHMGETAEHLAQKYNVSRQQQDAFAFNSQMKTKAAISNSYFHNEIVPVTVKQGRNEITVTNDEFPKPNTTKEALAKLKAVFASEGSDNNGTVTAGNASGINDGAAALVLSSFAACQTNQLKPIARIIAFGQTALEPIEMGLGPVEAVNIVLKKAGWTIDQVDLFELNEAFAVQSILVNKMLNIPNDKVNISGGAIALGHPIGCSGARILVTLLHNMQRLQKSNGIAALCVGGGMGIAIAVQLF